MPRAHNHPGDAQAVHGAIHAIVTKIMRPLVRLPRAKFMHEAVSGIVRQRTLVHRDIARAVNETSKAPGTVERRLTAHINDPGLADSINAGLLSHGASRVHVYTPMAIDLTDTQRRYAHNTPGAEGNYDGRTGTPGWGYTHIGVTAVVPGDDGVEQLLLYQETYALEHTHAKPSDDPLQIDSSYAHYERAVRTRHETLGGPVRIDVMDRGMDSRRCFGCARH